MVNLGAAAFWIALAAVLIAGGWFKSRSEAQNHETLRKIIERTGTVDEAVIKELFCGSKPAVNWADPKIWNPPPSPPGHNFKALRVLGMIVLSIAAAIAVIFGVLGSSGVRSEDATIGV